MDTIKSDTEISDIFHGGKRSSGKYVTLIYRENSNESKGDDETRGRQGRVAFIAGKRHGNAVWRNAAKRRMRELCRAHGAPWAGYDVLVVAKGRINDVPYGTVSEDLDAVIDKAVLRTDN